MLTFKDIIDAFTAKRLAEIFGVPESHVRTMRARDSIPPEYWRDVVTNAPDEIKNHVSFDTLWTLRKERFGKTHPEAGDAA